MTSAPPAPRTLPLLGHAPELLRDPLAFLRSLPAAGDLVEVRLGTHRMLMVCTPGLTRKVLTDSRTFDKGGPFYKRIREVFGNGLGSCPHAEHQRQRRLVQPAFSPHRYAAYAAVMTDRIGQVLDDWRDGTPLDVFAEMQRITGYTSLATMLAHQDVRPEELPPLLDDLNTAVRGVFWRMFLPSALERLPLPANRRHARVIARMDARMSSFVGRYRASPGDHQDLMSALIRTTDPEATDARKARLSDQELVDQLKTFFVAGADSTASVIAWALHLVSGSPRVAAELHREVDEVLAGRVATYADLPRLEATGRVITETLRLYPPGWLLTRTATCGTELGGVPVGVGSTVAISPYLIHHHAGVHPEPEVFRPERWADRGGTGTAEPAVDGSMVPFAAGARKCIGDTFAVTQATLTLATVAARWTLRTAPGARPRPALSALLVPKDLRMIPTARARRSGPRAPTEAGGGR